MFKTFFDENFARTCNYNDIMTLQDLFEAFRMWSMNTYNNTNNMPSIHALRTFMNRILKHNRKGYVGIVNKKIENMD